MLHIGFTVTILNQYKSSMCIYIEKINPFNYLYLFYFCLIFRSVIEDERIKANNLTEALIKEQHNAECYIEELEKERLLSIQLKDTTGHVIQVGNRVTLLKISIVNVCMKKGTPWSSCSLLDHRSLPPVFKYRRGHIWGSFHPWLRFITYGSRSAHLAYHAHKSGHKTSIIIIFAWSKHLRIAINSIDENLLASHEILGEICWCHRKQTFSHPIIALTLW